MGSYGNNGYVVVCPETRESLVIDTPGEPEKLIAAAGATRVRCILITHTHFDHLVGFEEIRAALNAPVGVHASESDNLSSPSDFNLVDGDTITIGTVVLKVLHTPGHTPGSMCFLSGKHLFSGDTLFPGGPGRTRTPADLKRILESISSKLLVLPEDTIVYPGHGNNTTIGDAQLAYAIFASRTHPEGLCGDVQWLGH
ncbi:MAG: MBL fold metallo-hydrolase [Chloroflexi bacterium]|nr:MBL fold metallo-hydrolase [Chloroflexota bacterium]